MTSSFRAAAAAVLSTVATVALASEGPEGLGDMQGVKPLLYLVAGVTVMGFVIWLML
jgi:hypothetical protein